MMSGINESTDFDTKDGQSSSDDDSSVYYNTDSYSDNDEEQPNENNVRDISNLCERKPNWGEDWETLSSDSGCSSPNHPYCCNNLLNYDNGKLIKEMIRPGFGWRKPRIGEEVRVHYVGKLLDGTVFDSSRDRDELLVFRVGRKEVIAGWDIALRTMKRGEIAKFTIAPQLAYGEQGMTPDIPPNATLEYEIELFDWILVDCTKSKDKGVCKRIMSCGTGHDNPNMCSKCHIHIVGKYNKRVFDERTVRFICGQALDSDLIEAIDLVVCRMKMAEKCEAIVGRQYAFNEEQCVRFGIPTDYQQVIYEVTLIDFVKAKETYEMNENEKLEQSELAKSIGTKYFQNAKYSSAVRQYKRIHKLFGYLEHFSDDEIKSKRDQLLLAAYLNLSLCYLKLNDDNQALKYSNLALKLDANNVKALFRRGLSHYNLKNYGEASADFIAVLRVEPSNKSAKDQMIVCKDAIIKHTEIEKSVFRKMFANKSSDVSENKMQSPADSSCECGTSFIAQPLHDSVDDQTAP